MRLRAPALKKCAELLFFLLLSFSLAVTTTIVLTPNIFNGVGVTDLLREKKSLAVIAVMTVGLFLLTAVYARSQNRSQRNSTRESNLELCRIVCMLMIIAHHCVIHGGAFSVEGLPECVFISYFLIPGGKLGFDCFIAISCWFLVDQKFKFSRFLRIWLMVLFYSVVFTVVSACMGSVVTWRNWFSVFLPMSGNSHGFAASYIAFYLLVPFLGKVTENITKKQARLLWLLMFYFEVVTQLVGYFAQYRQPMSCEIFVFVLGYLTALNLKRWPLRVTDNRYTMLSVFAVIWVIMWLARYYWLVAPGPISQFILSTMCDESSVSNLVGGFALFFFFKSIKIPKSPVINALASGTFGVLLIHDHNFFRYPFWGKIVRASLWYYHDKFAILVVMFTLWTFAACFIVDRIRMYMLERPVMRLKAVRTLGERYDAMLNERAVDCQSAG